MEKEEEEQSKLYICRAASCKKNGSDKIVDALEKVLKTKIDESAQEDVIKLEGSSCMGNCSYGPNIKANGKIYNRVDKEILKRVLVIMKSRLMNK